jgi:hypothetical protein
VDLVPPQESEIRATGPALEAPRDLPAPLKAALQAENTQMMEKLDSMEEQIRFTETKMAQIAELQSTLSRNIAQQAEEITTVYVLGTTFYRLRTNGLVMLIRVCDLSRYNLVVDSNTDLDRGNEQLDKAAQSLAGYEKWMMFFLLLCAGLLLLLDYMTS